MEREYRAEAGHVVGAQQVFMDNVGACRKVWKEGSEKGTQEVGERMS